MSELIASTIIWPAEKLVNHLLGSDPYLQEKFKQFAGKCLSVQVFKPDITVTAFLESDRISLSSANADQLNVTPDASVAGEASDLMTLLTNKETPLANTQITISGDAQLVQDIYTTLHSLDIQWADLMATLTGDVIAHEADQLVHDLASWSKQTNQRVKRSVNDYLVEESRQFPHPTEVEKFSMELDELRLKIDRVNAKTELLYQKLDQVND
ncbi:MAG: SCP2 sterol-binding domain-containing protein [Gammaproteobacteria bacterium]|nr:SCP2 sterol-binding domain-containing protein [Gammaproteobacteria bacterium]MDD9896893.1 SCP2 sterol-binding domain-containing protein [Gammaproteobacteria bacterium]MDD9960139.1 SCP2 sterol-binding domain-containing protein [Gammaproteobacteria bacterium]